MKPPRAIKAGPTAAAIPPKPKIVFCRGSGNLSNLSVNPLTKLIAFSSMGNKDFSAILINCSPNGKRAIPIVFFIIPNRSSKPIVSRVA